MFIFKLFLFIFIILKVHVRSVHLSISKQSLHLFKKDALTLSKMPAQKRTCLNMEGGLFKYVGTLRIIKINKNNF